MISHPGASTSSIGEMLRQKADEELANMETEQESWRAANILLGYVCTAEDGVML